MRRIHATLAAGLLGVAVLASGCGKREADATHLAGPNGGGSTAPSGNQPIQIQKD